MAPKRVGGLDDTIRKVLTNGLATRFCVQPKVAKNFFRRLLNSRVNCVALKVRTSCTRVILDGRDASFVRVCEPVVKCFSKLIYLYLSLDSMSNLLIETSAIETFPKSSSFKRSSGRFSPSSSSPFPKARNFKQTSLKMFVLRLFGKFMPLYPTPKGCSRFRSTHKVGPWTP